MGTVGTIFGIFNAVASVCAFAIGDVAHGVLFGGGAIGAFIMACKGDGNSSSAPQPNSGPTL